MQHITAADAARSCLKAMDDGWLAAPLAVQLALRGIDCQYIYNETPGGLPTVAGHRPRCAIGAAMTDETLRQVCDANAVDDPVLNIIDCHITTDDPAALMLMQDLHDDMMMPGSVLTILPDSRIYLIARDAGLGQIDGVYPATLHNLRRLCQRLIEREGVR